MALIPLYTLWSLEDVKPNYVFDTETLNVINTDTDYTLCRNPDKRGYPVVYVPTNHGRRLDVKLHKIIALAMINNGPYILIEHLDDNPLNFNPDNLKFSNKRENSLSMIRNGLVTFEKSIYRITLADGRQFEGSIKELAKKSGIAAGTIYDRILAGRATGSVRKGFITQVEELFRGKGCKDKTIHSLGISEDGYPIVYIDENAKDCYKRFVLDRAFCPYTYLENNTEYYNTSQQQSTTYNLIKPFVYL